MSDTEVHEVALPSGEVLRGNNQKNSGEIQNSDLTQTENSATSSTVQAVKNRTDRKLSKQAKQNRVSGLVANLSTLISGKLTEFEHSFSVLSQNDAEALEEYVDTLNSDVDEVEVLYNELRVLCDNKITDHVQNMYDLFQNEVSSNRGSIDTQLEKIHRLEEEEVAKAEAVIQQQLKQIQELSRRQADARKAFEARARASLADREQQIVLQKPSPRSPAGQLISVATAAGSSQELHSADNGTDGIPSMSRYSSIDRSENDDGEVRSLASASSAEVTAIEKLAESITQSMRSTKRSVVDPTVFYGDVLRFKEWQVDFDDFLQAERITTPTRKIRMLAKFLGGEARTCVEGYLMQETEIAYSDARKLLQERYGKKLQVSRLLKKRLKEWPRIPPKDVQALQKFGDFLSHLDSARQTIPNLNSLDEPESNEDIVEKLPEWLKNKWKYQVRSYEKEHDNYPPFRVFKNFIREEAITQGILTSDASAAERKGPEATLRKRTQTAHTTVTAEKGTTKYCKRCEKDNHYTAQCNLLVKATYEDALKFFKDQRLCFHCAKDGHSHKTCPKRWRCRICKKEHPDCLHKTASDWNQSKSKAPPAQQENKQQNLREENLPTQNQIAAAANVDHQAELLNMLLPVTVSSDDNETITVYAMLDTGSDTTYITEAAIQRLHISPDEKAEKVTIQTLNGIETGYRQKYKLAVQGVGPAAEAKSYHITAYEQAAIPYNKSHIPTSSAAAEVPHLSHIAHLLPHQMDIPVELLIGRDNSHLLAPYESIIGAPAEPFAIRTALGWTLCGGNQEIATRLRTLTTQQNEFEDLHDRRKMSQNDLKFLEMLENGMQREDDGSVTLPLPFASTPHMPNNKSQALKRLQQQIRKLKKDRKLAEEYCKFMQGIIESGHAELVTDAEPPEGKAWYLPHFEVYHPRKKTLRIVFDASVKFDNRCLNEELLAGPDHMNILAGILLRFRRESVAISCDIQKMFHNFKVNTEHRDYLRFLWVDADLETVREYRMTVHLFGATSSPGVATFALRKLAFEAADEYPAAASFITNDFYVDDGITSVASAEEAENLIKDSMQVCKSANLRLHKFLSNDREVLGMIPKSEVNTNLQELDIHKQQLPSERTLGLEWCTESDSFTFNKDSFTDTPPTKRGILSSVSQIYDPLGFLAPYVLQGRLIVQQSCQSESLWDDTVPPPLEQKWTKWKQSMKDLGEIKIPRCMKPPDFREITRREIHYFGDASLEGYGVCAYIRLVNIESRVHVTLLAAKSRVPPLKGMGIPRLELQAAVEAVRLANFIRMELRMPIDQEYFWTDSTSTLGFIKNSSTQFHMFTANRVSEIRQNSNPAQWYHISGSENPADIASRGATISELANGNWYTGPSFLHQLDFNHRLSVDKSYEDEIKDSPEIKRTKVGLATQSEISSDQFITKFSSWKRLVRAVANAKAMIQNKSFRKPQLTVANLISSEKTIIKLAQQQDFSDELKTLHDNSTVRKTSRIRSLTPFLDQDNIIRMTSRSTTSVTFEEQHPAIVAKSALAKLLITHYHTVVHHQGTNATVAAVRQAGFWVIGAPALTKSVIRDCISCKKQRNKAMEQQMAPLPTERTEPSAPFTQVGIDAFGPFEVKDRRTILKRWGLLFTCLYSRAVHIELLDDLSADSYLQALRRFESIRGPVSTIFCDGGTNFLGGRNQQENDLIKMEESKLKDYLMQNKIVYKVNTPAASHQGGVWERQIRTIRAIFSSMFGKYSQRLTTEALRTAFYEIMAAINNRPLSGTSVDDEDPIITANRLLTAKPSFTRPPPGDFSNEEMYGREMYRKVQQLAEEFWEIWKSRYLTSIEQRTRWENAKNNLKVGDIVLIIDGNEHRNYWKTGKVLAVHPSHDHKVRKASILVATSDLDSQGKPTKQRTVLERPIQKLVHIMSCY